jgi:hypothetical protein
LGFDKPEIGRQKDTPSFRAEPLFAFKTVERFCQNAVPAILPNPLRFFLRDAYHPFCCFWRASFLSESGQRKEAKEDRLLVLAFILIV